MHTVDCMLYPLKGSNQRLCCMKHTSTALQLYCDACHAVLFAAVVPCFEIAAAMQYTGVSEQVSKLHIWSLISSMKAARSEQRVCKCRLE